MSDTVLTVIQGILAFVFLMAGVMKLAQTREKVMASGGKWAEDFTGPAIKVIGVAEVLLAVGVIAPQFLGQYVILSGFAAVGIAVIMAGAFFTHLRRQETPFLVVTGVFFALASFVAYSRLMPLA